MTCLGWLALLAVSLTTAAAAPADETERGWQFEVAAPYLWIPEEHGHIGLGPVSVPVDVEFDDIFDLMGKGDLLGGAGHFEAHDRDHHLTLFFDATGSVVDTEASLANVPGGKVEADTSLVFLESRAATASGRGRSTARRRARSGSSRSSVRATRTSATASSSDATACSSWT